MHISLVVVYCLKNEKNINPSLMFSQRTLEEGKEKGGKKGKVGKVTEESRVDKWMIKEGGEMREGRLELRKMREV